MVERSRKLLLAACASVALLACGAAGPQQKADPSKDAPLPAVADGKLIVHEWGTFTSFAGSDGVYLDYRTTTGGDLPPFVYDRPRASQFAQHREAVIRSGLGEKFRIPSLSRMETPVTYFYTDKPMAVSARVDFPDGLLTEFYPPPRGLAPMATAEEAAGKVPAVRGGVADWGRFTVIPEAMANEKERTFQVAQGAGIHYAAARATDSDVVLLDEPTAEGQPFREKFLFYRGVGNFQLPLTMKSLGQGRFDIEDRGKTPIAAAFLISVDRGTVRFTKFDHVDGPRHVALPTDPSPIDALGDAVAKDLVASGMYDKEARAMVETWRTSWFGEDGTRLLYLLPQSVTDKVLPLKITPKPQQTVRVMVGRLEALTPESESQLGKLILQLGADDFATRDAATKQIHKMGRFAEPALRRVAASTQDPEVRGRAESLLGQMR